jgi:hypothetical protein
LGSARHGRFLALTTSVTALAVALLVSPAPALAEGLGGLLRQGASKVGEGAQAVGRGVSHVGKSVDDSIRETERAMTNGDDPVVKRAELDAMATNALQRLFEEQPQALDLFLLSAGYAVFDTRRLAVAGVAAGGGKGVAVSGDRKIYMNMGTAGLSVSFGLGGFATQQVIFFETPWDFENFLADGFDARAEAAAMVGKDAESLGLNFVDGRATFALTGQGWKVSATATGTKYWPDRVLNAVGP